MHSDQRRIIQLHGTRNLRDVGGYPTVDGRQTRWRTLYRSDCLDRLDEAGQVWLVQAGLRNIIDLRDRAEVAERPNVFANSAQVAYRRLPFWDQPPLANLAPDLSRGYRHEVDELGERLVQLVETLTGSDALPTLVHCAEGKDRTGVAIAIVLAAVGTRAEAIAEDYALTEACLGPEYRSRAQAWVLSRGYDWSIWEHTISTPPRRMLETLAYLDEKYRGVEQYLLRHGLAPNVLRHLRQLLTEVPAES
jgi:protein tyrosine/serine phosphatase